MIDPSGRQIGCCYGSTNADRFVRELNRLDQLLIDALRKSHSLDPTSTKDEPLSTNCTRCGVPGVLNLAKGLCSYCLVNTPQVPPT